MAAGDLKQFHVAAAQHARALKKLVTQAEELRAFWDKLDLGNSNDAVDSPLVKNDLINYATLCSALMSFADNAAVATADRKSVYERVGTQPVSA